MSKIRLDKLISNMGLGTRSEVRLGIKKRFACVNGEIVKDPGAQVEPDVDVITWKGLPVKYKADIYVMMNKPAGVVSATEDKRDRTVLDILKPPYDGMGLFPVGRLDKDTEGLLLLTNNGELAHNLLSPKKKVPKRYAVTLNVPLSSEGKKSLETGIPLEDFTTSPAQVESVGLQWDQVVLTIYEGRFHQVKRMMQYVGCEVVYLKRLSMGNLSLDESLTPGDYRELTTEEMQCIGVDAG